MLRAFDITLIEKRNNPFSNTGAVDIWEGVHIKIEQQSSTYRLLEEDHVEMGIYKKLKKRIGESVSELCSKHTFIVGKFGHGKTFALRKMEDEMYLKGYPVIATKLGADLIYQMTRENGKFRDQFQDWIRQSLEKVFDKLPLETYPNRDEIRAKHKLYKENDEELTFDQFLSIFDAAFGELNVLVYIFIDELDKIVVDSSEEWIKRKILTDLSSVFNNCKNSISIIIAGSPNCSKLVEILGRDYTSRFQPVDTNELDESETIRYIKKKCVKKVPNHHLPFTRKTLKIIYSLTNGNIRRVETLAQGLWNHCHETNRKVDDESACAYIQPTLIEPIKKITQGKADETTVHFIAKLAVHRIKNGDEPLPEKEAFDGYRETQINSIKAFLESNKIILKIENTYKISGLQLIAITQHFAGAD